MRKTRPLLSILLACLLVFIQQAGFAHALSHLASPNSRQPIRNDAPHPAEKVCIECVAFAQLGAGLTGQAVAPAVALPPVAAAEAPARIFDLQFIPVFRSRAPPSLV